MEFCVRFAAGTRKAGEAVGTNIVTDGVDRVTPFFVQHLRLLEMWLIKWWKRQWGPSKLTNFSISWLREMILISYLAKR